MSSVGVKYPYLTRYFPRNRFMLSGDCFSTINQQALVLLQLRRIDIA